MADYGVYIIESLDSDDYFDGENLNEILKLSLMTSEYDWVDSIEDFIQKLHKFKNLDMRYLHLSCHANSEGIFINGDQISYWKLASLLDGKLKNKRLFMSACKGVNIEIAARSIIKSEGLSLIGTPINLDFDKSTLFWPAFYHVMHENDKSKMIRSDIKDTIKRCVELFEIPIDYYSRITNNPNSMRRCKFRKGVKTDNRVINTNFKTIKIDARKK